MSLLDHFHEPLVSRRSWESFNACWAVSIGDWLHKILPSRYYAEIHIHLGRQVKADVAEFDEISVEVEDNSAAVALQTYAPPVATCTLPAVFPDDIEIQIRDEKRDLRLVAVVELISPRNKARAESRRAFAAKCLAYLQRGIGLVIVDIVSSYHRNLHNEVIDLLNLKEPFTMPDEAFLYAVAYRPIHRQEKNEIDVWMETLALGGSLSMMPLALRGAKPVPLDLQTTYKDACQRSRLVG